MLTKLIADKREDIHKQWFDMIVASYPENTADFLKNQKNQFANPVGHTIREMTAGVLDTLANKRAPKDAYDFIDRFVRVRAVQDFTPSKALDFLFMLKKIIKDEFKDELKNKDLYEEFHAINSTIDDMVLGAFESYVKYRERIYELKVNEFKNMAYRLLEKANLTFEFKDENSV
jgi:hypothetical protein